MKKKIEFLIMNIENLFFGLDCNEVKKIFSNVSLSKEKELIKHFGIDRRYYNLCAIAGAKDNYQNKTVIEIDRDDENNFMLSVPFVSGIINADAKEIMTVPDYIRQRQDPFFVWGFINNEDKLIALITFAFFKIKG